MRFIGESPWENFGKILKKPGTPVFQKVLMAYYPSALEYDKVSHVQKAGVPAKGFLKPSETFSKTA